MPLFPTGRRFLLLTVVLVLLGSVTYALWRGLDPSNDPFSATCLDIDAIVCSDTVDSLASFPDLALVPRPEARVEEILVRRTLETDPPSTARGDWAIEAALSDGRRIVARCYYSSDHLVTCELGE